MDENEIEEELEEVEDEQVEEVEEEPIEEPTEPNAEVEELKKKLATTEAQKEHWREKAGKKETVTSSSSTSLSDQVALIKADVHEDDIERVVKFAKDEGISIKDAVKNRELKAILGVRGEQRKTAEATNVSNVRRGSVKVSDDVLVHNANTGKIPTDDAEIARLISAKRKQN